MVNLYTPTATDHYRRTPRPTVLEIIQNHVEDTEVASQIMDDLYAAAHIQTHGKGQPLHPAEVRLAKACLEDPDQWYEYPYLQRWPGWEGLDYTRQNGRRQGLRRKIRRRLRPFHKGQWEFEVEDGVPYVRCTSTEDPEIP